MYWTLKIPYTWIKLSKRKWIRPLEIVHDGFSKEDLLVRKKLPVLVDITEWIRIKGLKKIQQNIFIIRRATINSNNVLTNKNYMTLNIY